MTDTFLSFSWTTAFRTLPPAMMLGHTMSYQMISHPDRIKSDLMSPEASTTTTDTMAEHVTHTVSRPKVSSINDVLLHRNHHQYHRYEHPLSSNFTENVFINQVITGTERWAKIGAGAFFSLIFYSLDQKDVRSSDLLSDCILMKLRSTTPFRTACGL